MLVRTSKCVSRVALLFVLFAAIFFVSRTARADEMIIKHPGDHPNYSVEIEPHFAAGFFRYGASGIGLGGRFTIPVVKNGFVSTINNNVGIGFGIDWLHYSGCYYGRWYYYSGCYFNSFWFPIDLQWNFFLATHWSVFAELGLAIVYSDWGGPYYGGGGTCFDRFGNPYDCGGGGPNHFELEPVVFIGGRYHFSESVALTLRLGWPYLSIGVSFML